MKLWEILETGQIGDIYKATQTAGNWEGVEIQVQETPYGHPILVFATLPASNSTRIGVGRTVMMCGAVTDAEWVAVGNRERVEPTIRTRLHEIAMITLSLLNTLQKHEYQKATEKHLLRRKIEWNFYVEEYLPKMLSDIEPLQLIDQTDYHAITLFLKEMEWYPDALYHWNNDECSEKLEALLACICYFFSYWKVPFSPSEPLPFTSEEIPCLLTDSSFAKIYHLYQ